MQRLFGTDGIRGRFGEFPLDHETVTGLAVHLATTLRARGNGTPPRVVLGGDTRESTPEICRWLASGLIAGGIDLRYAGVIPTPGVAYLAHQLGAAAGVVVSASHNPWPDNGIKLLDRQGFKWSDEDEAALENLLAGPAGSVPELAAGELVPEPELRERYLRHLAATVPGELPLAGLRVVLDTGNGAASSYAGELFERLGAQVTLLHAEPNGRNVNEGCGSTAPGEMGARVVAEGADLGAAFDGDADRCILADETGEVRDGDAILYLWSTCLHRSDRLHPPRIVATSMSNLGLERALAAEGIGLVRCNVGDRYVVEAMRQKGLLLGGEQSGHIVQSELSSTGDGLLTALQMAFLRHQDGRLLSAMLAPFRRYPQILLNVRVAKKVAFEALPAVTAAARGVEERLGDDGRLVLRYSGTEPLARIMIEGPEQGLIDGLAGELATAIRGELGAG
ncbi:MAG: phosphoglucosamine mutase [Acidobacteriota bacterium]|jgi:phosphoglucosamine mutase|nr:phosphoglucosamine mutase [Acidobacteriota bacterium]